jgi:hypothetical protein
MKIQRQFETRSETPGRQTAHIGKMIADLDRVVRILACDIATEEERCGTSDRSHPAYPTLGRQLTARRDNLLVTIATLERQLEKVGSLETVEV